MIYLLKNALRKKYDGRVFNKVILKNLRKTAYDWRVIAYCFCNKKKYDIVLFKAFSAYITNGHKLKGMKARTRDDKIKTVLTHETIHYVLSVICENHDDEWDELDARFDISGI